MVDHSNLAYALLSRKLSSLGVDLSLHSYAVDLITLNCKTSGNWQYCNMDGRWKVFPLRVTIIDVNYMFLCETCIRFISQLEEEEDLLSDDDDVIGMKPASESSIKELLKRVRVGSNGKDVCTVCLEELNSAGGSSYASQMPCKHDVLLRTAIN